MPHWSPLQYRDKPEKGRVTVARVWWEQTISLLSLLLVTGSRGYRFVGLGFACWYLGQSEELLVSPLHRYSFGQFLLPIEASWWFLRVGRSATCMERFGTWWPGILIGCPARQSFEGQSRWHLKGKLAGIVKKCWGHFLSLFFVQFLLDEEIDNEHYALKERIGPLEPTTVSRVGKEWIQTV